MNVEDLTVFCQSLPQATAGMQWDDVLVFKVKGKIFCMAPLGRADLRINLKCAAEEVEELRERFPSVLPGYHMNKKYWNTVLLDGSLSDRLVCSWIRNSYRLVVAGLPEKERQGLGLMSGDVECL